MEMKEFKRTKDMISLLGVGCMRLPRVNPDKPDIDYDKAQEIIDYAYAQGANYFDTAHGYHGGLSEEFVGHALAKYPRESYFLATKMPGWSVHSEDDVHRIFDLQRKRLRTEYFDFYLMHAVNEDNQIDSYEKHNVWSILKKKQEEGLIKNLGFSFHDSAKVLADVCDLYRPDFVQIQLNYADWELQDAKSQYEVLESRGIPVIVMEPIRGGGLADLGPKANEYLKSVDPDRSVASWALRFAASLPAVQVVLSGMSTFDQVVDNVATMTPFVPLVEADKPVIAKARDLFMEHVAIPCTACQYCTEQCPAGIEIPKLFKAYNEYAVSKGVIQSIMGFMYEWNVINESSRADKCIGCKACVARCPQFIDIPAQLDMIAKVADELSADAED